MLRREGGEAEAMPAAKRPVPAGPPPWAALPLVAPFLDAASLAAAACVSTSWRAAFDADHLWAGLCRAHYPSALALAGRLPDAGGDGGPSSPHRRLFALFRSASTCRSALPPPRLALVDVAFAVDVFTAGGSASTTQRPALSFAVAADKAGVAAKNGAGLFLFAVDVAGDRKAAIGPGDWRVRWTAVRTGATARSGDAPAAVLLMDAGAPAARATGAVRFGGRGEAGVAERLPAPGCGGARLEAEVVVELSVEEEKVVVERVRLGVMCDCRYVAVDEGLRYLQHFLL
ncbi:hypothetical protein ACP4OV_019538 [Aristida adscensionis]